jgi:Mrp family chromosome partitioning ATPase
MTDDTLDTGSPARSTLDAYLRTLRRNWWVVATTTAIAVIAAAVYTQTATPKYAATTKIVIGQGRALFSVNASGAFQPFTQTMTDLLQSDVVARDTIAREHLDLTPQQLLSKLTITSNPDTSVLVVSYTDTDGARAKRILGTLSNVFVTLVDKQQGQAQAATGQTTATPATTTDSSNQSEPVSATVFDPAHTNPDKVSPHTKVTIVLALILGLIVGTLLAFLRDVLSGRIRSEDEAAESFGGRVLAPLPPGVLGTKPSQVAFLPATLSSQVAESVQLMAAALRFGATDGQSRVIVITSARPEDGKSTVAAHLSSALARTGSWVVAVEADLHRPTLHRLLDVPQPAVGLTDVLAGDVPLGRALVEVAAGDETHSLVAVGTQPTDGNHPGADSHHGHGRGGEESEGPHGPQLDLLAAGAKHPNPAELLSLGATGELLTNLRGLSDYVVVDTPPVLLSGDAFPLLQLADHVVVVCREGQTTREEGFAVQQRFASLGVKNYSVVMTNSSEAQRRTYGYTYAG